MTSDSVARALRGEHGAWMELLSVHGPAIYGLCRRLTSDPDDAYQEIWEKIHQRLGQFDPARAGSFRGWLLTLAHRQLIDRHRRESARAAGAREDPPPPQHGLEAQIALRQRWQRIEASLHHLPIPDRRALVMYHLEERDLDEIATIEGVPRGTVKSRLHRARCRLLELMGGRDEP